MKTKKQVKKPIVLQLRRASGVIQDMADQMLIDSLGDETETFENQPPMNSFQAMLAGMQGGIKPIKKRK